MIGRLGIACVLAASALHMGCAQTESQQGSADTTTPPPAEPAPLAAAAEQPATPTTAAGRDATPAMGSSGWVLVPTSRTEGDAYVLAQTMLTIGPPAAHVDTGRVTRSATLALFTAQSDSMLNAQSRVADLALDGRETVALSFLHPDFNRRNSELPFDAPLLVPEPHEKFVLTATPTAGLTWGEVGDATQVDLVVSFDES